MHIPRKSDLILGAIAGYDIHAIKPFIISLKRTRFRGTLCFIAMDIRQDTQDILRSLGVEIVPVKDENGLLRPLLGVLRNFFYYEYLSSNAHRFKRVMLTDVSDVVFQRDPFAFDLKDELCCFLEDEQMTLATCPFNSQWLSLKFSHTILDEIGKNPISCSGTMIGSLRCVLEYLERMVHYSTPPLMFGSDQGIHNYLVYGKELSNVTLFRNEHGPVITLGYTPSDAIRSSTEGLLINSEGSVIHVIHQYNRHPDLNSMILSTYSEFTPDMFVKESHEVSGVYRQIQTEPASVPEEISMSASSPATAHLEHLLDSIPITTPDGAQTINHLLMGLFSHAANTTDYWPAINDFRVKNWKLLQDGRPKVLTNGMGGRFGLSLLANADCMFFTPAEALKVQNTTTITYSLYEDSFLDIVELLPPGWEPDIVLFFIPEVMPLPLGLELSPYPVVALAGDPWKAGKLSQDSLFLDAMVPGMKHLCPAYERLGTARILYAPCAGLQGYVPWMLCPLTDPSQEKSYDVIFTGIASSPYYRRRSQYLRRLLKLGDRYRIFVGFTESMQECHRLMSQSKIVVHCPSLQGGVNLRPFEAVACGALLLHEESDGAIVEFLEPGREVVLFNESNFEELIAFYVTHDEEREAISKRSQERIIKQGNIVKHVEHVLDALSFLIPMKKEELKNRRGALNLAEDRRWNVLGISDTYAGIHVRAAECFRKALRLNPEEGKYANNLSVSLMKESLRQGGSSPEIESLLLNANREGSATLISRFNQLSWYRYLEARPQEFLKCSGEFIRDLRNDEKEFPSFTADELVFHLDSPNNLRSDHFIFHMEMEFSLLRYPSMGPAYQKAIRKTLLWRTLEYRGDFYSAMGEPASAVASYELALRQCPRNESILAKLAELFLQMDAPEQAENCLKDLLELSALDEAAHLQLSRIQIVLGKEEELRERLAYLLRYQGLKNRESFELILEELGRN